MCWSNCSCDVVNLLKLESLRTCVRVCWLVIRCAACRQPHASPRCCTAPRPPPIHIMHVGIPIDGVRKPVARVSPLERSLRQPVVSVGGCPRPSPTSAGVIHLLQFAAVAGGPPRQPSNGTERVAGPLAAPMAPREVSGVPHLWPAQVYVVGFPTFDKGPRARLCRRRRFALSVQRGCTGQRLSRPTVKGPARGTRSCVAMCGTPHLGVMRQPSSTQIASYMGTIAA